MAEEKILIADDDPAVRRLLIRVVEGSGFQAVTACDGTEAVHLASRESFALILLDIMIMETMTAFTLSNGSGSPEIPLPSWF